MLIKRRKIKAKNGFNMNVSIPRLSDVYIEFFIFNPLTKFKIAAAPSF